MAAPSQVLVLSKILYVSEMISLVPDLRHTFLPNFKFIVFVQLRLLSYTQR